MAGLGHKRAAFGEQYENLMEVAAIVSDPKPYLLTVQLNEARRQMSL